jgi:thiamine-phosphate pyrophosphorylase
MKKNLLGIHVLLGASTVNGRSAEELSQIAVDSGATVIQIREKEMPMDQLLPIAKKIRAICRDITFIVNDRVDLAKIIDADGVHLGQEDLPIRYAREILGEESIIGMSCGTVEEAIKAEIEGADYIGFGHMYPTLSKFKSTPPKSLKELDQVCSAVKIPVIVIGGITVNNLPQLKACNPGGIAILSAFSNAENPKEALISLRNIFEN